MSPHPVHEVAEKFRSEFMRLGRKCGPIEHSINRHGEASSYFDALGVRFRVSDHDANQSFRLANEHSIFFESATACEAARLVKLYRRLHKVHAWRRKTEIERRDQREAPFIERFLAAKEHERHAILIDCYPRLASVHEKQNRQVVRDRWVRKGKKS